MWVMSIGISQVLASDAKLVTFSKVAESLGCAFWSPSGLFGWDNTAVMHSGITLAPLVGRLSAEEIVSGHALDTLEPYRLDRFTH